MSSSHSSSQVFEYIAVNIPTASEFLEQWHDWVSWKISSHFKHNKDRIPDIAQRARLRLLQKEFVARWFFKHLTNDLVDLPQAMHVLGGAQVTYISQIPQADVINWSCILGKLRSIGFSEKESQRICDHISQFKNLSNAPHLDKFSSHSRSHFESDKCVKNSLLGRGCSRSCKNSLWRISDLLNFAKFDYERYFYSVQGHTIKTSKILRLLGYGRPSDNDDGWAVDASDFGSLESLYRQGRLKPSELTEHECVERNDSGSRKDGCSIHGCLKTHYSRGYCTAHYHLSRTHKCIECNRGREALNEMGVSLIHRWSDPVSSAAVSKLRWNDRQISGFLRDWRKTNILKNHPMYIMRSPSDATVEAGLKKYAYTIIYNDLINAWKKSARTDDLSRLVVDGRLDPEFGSEDTLAWDSSDEESPFQVIKDHSASEAAKNADHRFDIMKIMSIASLTDEEISVVEKIDLNDIPAPELAEALGVPVSRVHRIRSSALFKMRCAAESMDMRSFT